MTMQYGGLSIHSRKRVANVALDQEDSEDLWSDLLTVVTPQVYAIQTFRIRMPLYLHSRTHTLRFHMMLDALTGF